MSDNEQTVAIIGGTGQIGHPLAKHLMTGGHRVKLFSRKAVEDDPTGKLRTLRSMGGEIVVLSDMSNVEAMTEALGGVDTIVCSVPATKEIITEIQPLWLEAAVRAKVKRFVPNEFGLHTKGVDRGDGILFDLKKDFHDQLFRADIGWTLFYNGGIFDYFLPNLRFFEKITTFGDVDLPVYTHEIDDIGRFAALAFTDPRTLNRCVQMDFNGISQADMLASLHRNFPSQKFEYVHYTNEDIIRHKNEASDAVTTKRGAETDAERWGINYCIYVKGKLASFTDDTIRGTELYPDFQVSSKPEDALADPNFVFETSQE